MVKFLNVSGHGTQHVWVGNDLVAVPVGKAVDVPDEEARGFELSGVWQKVEGRRKKADDESTSVQVEPDAAPSTETATSETEEA